MSARIVLRLAALALGMSGCQALEAPPAGAVILAPGDGTGNTTAPPDDFGFANVGAMQQTGVYLGNGWVLTANHVKARDIRLGDSVFEPVPRSKRRLKNEGGGVSPDVALFRLREPLPDLPTLPIRATSPALGDEVVLAGNGRNRGAPVEFQGHRGWRWGEGTRVRWGTNHVHATDLTVQAGPGDLTVAFSTRLSIGHPTEHESTVAIGDSGGGAFIHDGHRWELAGLLFATRPHEGQPERTTLYGNLTLAADLAHYRDQVLAIAGVPACRDGLDDDGDGFIDFPADPGCDHPDDRQERSTCQPDTGTPGDADGDGRATGLDYTIWTEHFDQRFRAGDHSPSGDRGAPQAKGDFDCDGVVDAADFEMWREQYRRDRAASPVR